MKKEKNETQKYIEKRIKELRGLYKDGRKERVESELSGIGMRINLSENGDRISKEQAQKYRMEIGRMR